MAKSQSKLRDQPEQSQLFYLSDYLYGGCTTFTAHLLHILKRKNVLCLTKAFENDIGEFGYGIKYQRKSIKFLENVKKMFIVDMFQNFHLLEKIRYKDITIVIHSPTEISEENELYLKNWNIIVIRKTLQNYLKNQYDVKSKFLYHPFYPYKRFTNFTEMGIDKDIRTEAISIARIDYYKNTDIILKANKKLDNPIRIFGLTNPQYVTSQLISLDLERYYAGIFQKSFGQVSNILRKSKFMVDLSELPNDGGGTQYTFLEAIYNNSAIILNRKWIESIDKKYCDFEEGYNCYAVSNEQELLELINNGDNIDTTRIVQNATKLMHRHINVAEGWYKLVFSF